MFWALRASPKCFHALFPLLLSTTYSFLPPPPLSLSLSLSQVGLGGRLDATNVVERPLATGISALGMDHVELLGNTLPLIAAEKAGEKYGAPPRGCYSREWLTYCAPAAWGGRMLGEDPCR